MGFDIFLKKATEAMQQAGLSSSASVFLTPSNWKFLFFGAALVIMMRFRPYGVFPSVRTRTNAPEARPGPAAPSPGSPTPATPTSANSEGGAR
jgi:hypothetical protein